MAVSEAPRPPRVLRRRQVEECVGLSRSSLYRLISKSAFPKPIPLGPGSVGWLEQEVLDWIESRVLQREVEQERVAELQAAFQGEGER